MTDIHNNTDYTEPLPLGGLEITPLDLLQHVVAFGGTGSGKTRSCILPLIESVLDRFGDAPDKRAAMILLDAKGDMGTLARECIARAGRTDKVLVFGEGGNCWLPIFEHFNGDTTAVADFLFETLEDRSRGRGGENEAFWSENARRLLRASATLAKAQHGADMGGLRGFGDCLNTIISANTGCSSDDVDGVPCGNESATRIGEILDEGFVRGRIDALERDGLNAYIRHDVTPGNSRTWATIANMGRNYISQFSQRHLQALFEAGPGLERLCPEDVIDRGQILIVALSPVIYGEAATPFRLVLKKLFCDRILQRQHLVTGENPERPINQTRPVLYVMDEFHTTLTPGGRHSEVYFLDRAREFRCMCLLASQGISAIASVMGDNSKVEHLLNNCRTKFFFATDCPSTADYFQRAAGQVERRMTTSQCQIAPPPSVFRLPNHAFLPPRRFTVVGGGTDVRRTSRCKPEELSRLSDGTAIVVTKGQRVIRYTRDPASYACTKTAPEPHSAGAPAKTPRARRADVAVP